MHAQGRRSVEHLDKAALWLSGWPACPGNHQYNVRQLRISNINYADLSFIFGPHRGQEPQQHLKHESLAVLTTEQQTLYHLNLHVGQVGHTLTHRPHW